MASWKILAVFFSNSKNNYVSFLSGMFLAPIRLTHFEHLDIFLLFIVSSLIRNICLAKVCNDHTNFFLLILTLIGETQIVLNLLENLCYMIELVLRMGVRRFQQGLLKITRF